MGLFKKLFGGDDGTESETALGSFHDAERPYDRISEAIEAWQSKDDTAAERLFLEGVSSYERHEPDGVAFALGRYAAFLKDRGRTDEALKLLERAVEHPSETPPASIGDLFDILTEKRDDQRLFFHARRLGDLGDYPFDALLHRARRAMREGDLEFAEAVTREVQQECHARLDQAGVWAAVGDLGHVLEKAGSPDAAMELWRKAFDEGSDDPTTADRLTLNLERQKSYEDATSIVNVALTRGLPANVDERLRKRAARCKEKLAGKGGRPRAKSDVAAFSVRHGENNIHLLFQTRVSPAIRQVDFVGGLARCVGKKKDKGLITDIDVETGREVGRQETPTFDDVEFASSGHGVGFKKLGRVGDAQTRLTFLDPEAHVICHRELPDALSKASPGADQWYLGCRDGFLYAYEREGTPLWRWETPGAAMHEDAPTSRPCPYFVSASDDFVVVSSMGDLYGVDRLGSTRWHTRLPSPDKTTYTYSVGADGDLGPDAYKMLGLRPGASSQELKSAYRRMALDTHPARNPLDPSGNARFLEVQSAYEAIMSGSADGPSIEVEVSFVPSDPSVGHLRATATGVWASSTDGRIHRIDRDGRIIESRVLSDTWANFVLDEVGELVAAWSDNAIFVFRDGAVVNSYRFEEWLPNLLTWRDSVVATKRNALSILDHVGRLVWRADFSKSISGISTSGDRLVVAAGVLAVFDRVEPSSFVVEGKR
jgi:hypothetical protein